MDIILWNNSIFPVLFVRLYAHVNECNKNQVIRKKQSSCQYTLRDKLTNLKKYLLSEIESGRTIPNIYMNK